MKGRKSIIRIIKRIFLIYFYYKNFIKQVLEDFIFTRYTGKKKLKSLIKSIFETYIRKSDKPSNFPIKIVVDPTSHCNLRCPLCPTGNGTPGRSKGYMKFESFKKIIDEIGEYIFLIDFYNWGEPLLSKDVFNMIEYAHLKKIKTKMSTNLTIMTDKIAERIILSHLDVLLCSIDGARKETYEVYRVGAKFEKVFENLKTIIRKKKEMGARNPKVVWQFIIMKHNEKDIKEVKKLSRELGVELKIIPTRVDMGKEVFFIGDGYEWLPDVSRYDLPKPKVCFFLWSTLTINWNGSVSPCCAIYEEKYDLGFYDGIHIWWNEKFQRARKIVREKIIDENYVCSNCVKKGYFIQP